MQRTKTRSIEGKYRSRSKWAFLCTSDVTAVVLQVLHFRCRRGGLVKVIMNQDNLLWHAASSTRHGCRQLSQGGVGAPSKTPAWVCNFRSGMCNNTSGNHGEFRSKFRNALALRSIVIIGILHRELFRVVFRPRSVQFFTHRITKLCIPHNNLVRGDGGVSLCKIQRRVKITNNPGKSVRNKSIIGMINSNSNAY